MNFGLCSCADIQYCLSGSWGLPLGVAGGVRPRPAPGNADPHSLHLSSCGAADLVRRSEENQGLSAVAQRSAAGAAREVLVGIVDAPVELFVKLVARRVGRRV